jgi:DNA mismatch repair ATPase MutS
VSLIAGTADNPSGLELAKLASLPPEVMKVAWKVTTKLNDLEEKSKWTSATRC